MFAALSVTKMYHLVNKEKHTKTNRDNVREREEDSEREKKRKNAGETQKKGEERGARR